MITYLFGAGASAHAIPVIDGLPKAMKEMADKVRLFDVSADTQEYQFLNRNFRLQEMSKDLAKKIHSLADIAEKHQSIDTFAKKLYLKDRREEILEFKRALMAYLSLQQLYSQTDKRYDAFYASLLRDHLKDFPKNVRVVTWNYDNQFEKSYFEFSDGDDLRFVYYKNMKSFIDPSDDNFKIYKLNGSNVIFSDNFEQCDPMGDFKQGFGLSSIKKVCIDYYNLFMFRDNIRPGISFAWENASNFIDGIVKDVERTRILVIVGYSFPFFNRAIDKKLFEGMGHLSKIYIQSPDARKVRERLNSVMWQDISAINIILIDEDLDQFIIPNEL